MICLEHRIANPEALTPENKFVAFTSLEMLQVLSDEADNTDDFEKAESLRRQYWGIRSSLEQIGIEVEYLGC